MPKISWLGKIIFNIVEGNLLFPVLTNPSK